MIIGINLYDGIIYEDHTGGGKIGWLPVDDNDQFIGVSWDEKGMHRHDCLVVTRTDIQTYRVLSAWQVFSGIFESQVRKIRSTQQNPSLASKMKHKKILFVCNANHDRSPLAERLFREIVRHNLGHRAAEIKISSGGLIVQEWLQSNFKKHKNPLAPSPGTQMLLRQKGVNFSDFSKTQLSQKMIDDNEIIFVMTERQKEEITRQYSGAVDKVYLLREYAGYPPDRLDISTPQEFNYQVTYDFENALERILKRLTQDDNFDELTPVPIDMSRLRFPAFRVENLSA